MKGLCLALAWLGIIPCTLLVGDGQQRDDRSPELILQQGHAWGINAIAFSPDEKLVASASQDKTLKLWDAQTGRLLRTLIGHAGRVTSVRFSADGRLLISDSQSGGTAEGAGDGTRRLWDVRTGKLLRTLGGDRETEAEAMEFSPGA